MTTTQASTTDTAPKPRDWREARRFRVLELHRKGWTQRAIAEALGLSQGRVSQVLKAAGDIGCEAVRTRKASGASPKLSADQRRQVLDWLSQGAEAFGFAGDVWTSERIADLIARQLGVHYHPHHIPKLLRAWGWSPQKPIVRATQRNEAAIERWLNERWPRLQKN